MVFRKDTEPPVIYAPANIEIANEKGICSAFVNTGSPSATDDVGVDSLKGIRSDKLTLSTNYPVGITTITWTAVDKAGNRSKTAQTITVIDTEVPMITTPDNLTVKTDIGLCSTQIILSTVTATDNCSQVSISMQRSDKLSSSDPFPLGTTSIIWSAMDNAGNKTEVVQKVIVADAEAPIIIVSNVNAVLWPPNHAYHTFNIPDFVTSVTDNCPGIVTTRIKSVSSNEAKKTPGSGNTNNDIVIAEDCRSVQLMAERSGSGNGRVYTISIEAIDSAGNSATEAYEILVPHDASDSLAVNDGAAYTLYCSGAAAPAPTDTMIGPGLPEPKLGLYPNPAKQELTIEVPLDKAGMVHVSITSAFSNKVFRTQAFLAEGENKIFIHLEGLLPGLYNVNVRTGNVSFSEKLIIEN
jgi:hypothetical protein